MPGYDGNWHATDRRTKSKLLLAVVAMALLLAVACNQDSVPHPAVSPTGEVAAAPPSVVRDSPPEIPVASAEPTLVSTTTIIPSPTAVVPEPTIATRPPPIPTATPALMPTAAATRAATPTPPPLSCTEVTGETWLSEAFWDDAGVETVELALKCGVDIGAKTDYGKTALHIAASWSDNPAIVQALLEGGADTEAADVEGATPLHYAAGGYNNLFVIRALLEGGADVNARADRGWTPIHAAAYGNSNPAVIRALLEAGAGVHTKNTLGNTAVLCGGLWLLSGNHPGLAGGRRRHQFQER